MEQRIPGHALPAGTGGAAPGHLASLAVSLAARMRLSQRGQFSLQPLLDNHSDATEEREKRRGAAEQLGRRRRGGGGEEEEKRKAGALEDYQGRYYYYDYYYY